MAVFNIQCSKDNSQQNVTVRQTDNVDLSSTSMIVVSIFTSNLQVADRTYTLVPSELNDFRTNGVVTLTSTDLFGDSFGDDFYLVQMNADSGANTSTLAGVGVTLEATGRVYSNQGLVDVYSPNFRIDRVLHSTHILLAEMNAIENIESSEQKRADYTTRLDTIRQILNY